MTSVTTAEALVLVERGVVRPLDVRSAPEHARLGHIPGSRLLPVGLIASAPGVLTPEGPRWLVYCEDGTRSLRAARLLAAAGYEGVLNLGEGMSTWTGPREHTPTSVTGPSSWLTENADVLQGRQRVLDVACGWGRHALLLAAAGFEVHAVDRDPERLAWLRTTALRLGLKVVVERRDLEGSGLGVGAGTFDVVLVVNYLHRPLLPALVDAVAPDGVLVYETFTRAQAMHGRPTNPAFLLEPGELSRLVEPLIVRRTREGSYEGRMIASIVAQRPASAPSPRLRPPGANA